MSVSEKAIQSTPVSPTGKSIVESVRSGETDPTVPQFQAARKSFLDGILNFFKGFNFLTNRVFWVVVAIVVILVLVAIVKKG